MSHAQAVNHHSHDLRLVFPRVLYWDQSFSFFILPSQLTHQPIWEPQSSFTAPRLPSEISFICRWHSALYFFRPGNFSNEQYCMQRQIASISYWLTSNFLSVNPCKTEFLLIGLIQQLAKVNQPDLHLPDNTTVTPVTNARNLGIVFDSNLSFKQHINFLTNTCLYHCRDLRRIRSWVDFGTAVLLQQLLSNPC